MRATLHIARARVISVERSRFTLAPEGAEDNPACWIECHSTAWRTPAPGEWIGAVLDPGKLLKIEPEAPAVLIAWHKASPPKSASRSLVTRDR
jgi:hypothetical protein